MALLYPILLRLYNAVHMIVEESTVIDTETKTQAKPLAEEDKNSYDLIIIGAGMAGITCAIYARRAQLNILLLESKISGGQITTSDLIENWPTYESEKRFIKNFNTRIRTILTEKRNIAFLFCIQ